MEGWFAAVQIGVIRDVARCLKQSPELTPDSVAGPGSLTALHVAVLNRHEDLAEWLIDQGAKVTARTETGATPLFIAAGQDDASCIRLLAKRGCGVDLANKDDDTPLHAAAQVGNLHALQCLLELGAKFETRNKRGQTPLMRACECGSSEGAIALLKKGAEVNALDRQLYLPIHQAVWRGDTHLAELLLRAGATATATANGSKPILLSAAENNHGPMVELLLSNGAEPDAEDPNTGETALHRAAWAGANAAASALFKAKANLDRQDHFGDTPLHLAVRNSNLAMVRFLTANGASKELVNDKGEKPADYAFASGFPELINLVEVSQQIGKEKVMI